MTENIFATEPEETFEVGDEFGDFELPTMAVGEVEDVEDAPRYERIPARTRLNFRVYGADFDTSSVKGTPFWKLELVLADEADQDKYGPKKRVFKDIYITEGTMKPFVKPLLKALGIDYDDKLTKQFVVKDFPELALDRIVSFQVIGYKWKNADTGEYEQSFGSKDKRTAVPTEAQLADWGSYLNEVVENARAPKQAEDAPGASALDGLSEFDMDKFV